MISFGHKRALNIIFFYRNMAIIACSSIAVIMCWVMRWEKPDLIQRSVHPNNGSCTSVLTCVEPSLHSV